MKHHERNEDKKEEPKYLITHLEREIIMKLEELLTINNSIKDQLTKIDQEIITKLAELQTAIDKLTEQLDEQAASVVAVQDAVNAIDAIIPDSIV